MMLHTCKLKKKKKFAQIAQSKRSQGGYPVGKFMCEIRPICLTMVHDASLAASVRQNFYFSDVRNRTAINFICQFNVFRIIARNNDTRDCATCDDKFLAIFYTQSIDEHEREEFFLTFLSGRYSLLIELENDLHFQCSLGYSTTHKKCVTTLVLVCECV